MLLVGIVSFVYIRVHQGDGASVLAAQGRSERLTAASVARVVRLAPDPGTNAVGRAANCRPKGHGVLLNPWRCVISYQSGRRIQYTVRITARGYYVGTDELLEYRGQFSRPQGRVHGCCIDVP